MQSKLDDKKLRALFSELGDAAPGVDLFRRINRRIFWDKSRIPFFARLLVFAGLVAALPFSYRALAGDFVKFEIFPMLGSILGNFEFSFDFISYQVNFVSSFLPLNSILIFVFNLLVFCVLAFFVFRDLKKMRLFGFKNFRAVSIFIIILSVSVLVFSRPVAGKAVEGPLSGQASAGAAVFNVDSGESPVKNQLVLTGIIGEVNAEMGQLLVGVRTVNDKGFASLKGGKIAIYTDEGTVVVKKDFQEPAISDLAEGDRVTVIGVLSGDTFWAEKIVAATPWWKRIFR